MALYVRDETVNALAVEVQRILKTPTKTEAIRAALQRVIDEDTARPPLAHRMREIRQGYRDLATPDPDFDHKAYIDRMWGES